MAYQLVTAAARNVITFRDYERVGKSRLQPSEVVIVTYNGTAMPSCNKALVQFKEFSMPKGFGDVKTDNHPYSLIGVEACLNTGIITIDEIVNAIQTKPNVTRDWLTENYDNVFRGIGLMPEEYKIKVDKAIQQVPQKEPSNDEERRDKKMREV